MEEVQKMESVRERGKGEGGGGGEGRTIAGLCAGARRMRACMPLR